MVQKIVQKIVQKKVQKMVQNYFIFSTSQEIDGRALKLLSLDEIHKCLGVTLGPAIKLHFNVQKLKKKPR